jgi:transposase
MSAGKNEHDQEPSKMQNDGSAVQVEEAKAATPEASQHTSLTPRLAWMICYNETRSAQEVCRRFGISRKTFYKWLKRYKESQGDSHALSDQSRRPHTFPRATPESSILLLKRIKDQTGFGQRRLRAYLLEHHNIVISERTIWKILKRLEQQEGSATKPAVNESGKIVYTSNL